MSDLLSGLERKGSEAIAPGAVWLKGFCTAEAPQVLRLIAEIAATAPFRRMVTPGGYEMSVAMTNCGAAGWVTDRRGYRYTATDPVTSLKWPPLPPAFIDLTRRASAAGGFAGFVPDACLINRYEPGTRLSLHQDRNEKDYGAPIVSVSLGLPATFLWGGERRADRPRRLRLESGDIVVWGGPARLRFHGVDPLPEGEDPLAGRCRINLTLRKAL